MHFSIYLYSLTECRHLEFDADSKIIESIRVELGNIRYEEGSSQFGRAVVTPELIRGFNVVAEKFADPCPKVKALPAYFGKLQVGDYFYVIDDSFPVMNRQIALVWLRAHGMGIDTRTAWNKFLEFHGRLKTQFVYHSFGFDGIRQYIGVKDKDARECRFCHGVTSTHPLADTYEKKGLPIVKFGDKNNAHAISDALGNKVLFCLEECTSCNERLSKVERNLIYLMDWRRSLMHVKTKDNGYATVFGEEAALRVDENGNQILYVDEDYVREYADGDSLNIRLNNKKTITDQGVYKALCKYVVSLMPEKYLKHFSQTIGWINGDISAVKLPEVRVAHKMPFVSQPVLDIYIRKDDDKSVPFCTAMLFVCDMCYLYILPFLAADEMDFTREENLVRHWNLFIQAYPAYWHSEDMSDYRPSTPWIDLEVPLKGQSLIVVPHGDKRLVQPVSIPKPGAKQKVPRHEHIFPTFDNGSIWYEGAEVTGYQLLHKGPIPADALHNATVRVSELYCEISLVEDKAEFSSAFIVLDPTDRQPYFKFGFCARFKLVGASQYIAISEEYIAFDYHLRDAIFYTACYRSESAFAEMVKGTPYSNCTLVKTLCEDERTVLHMDYKLITVDGIYRFKDTDVHNNPFDI